MHIVHEVLRGFACCALGHYLSTTEAAASPSPAGSRASLLGLLSDNGVLECIAVVIDEFMDNPAVLGSACCALEGLTLESKKMCASLSPQCTTLL